MNEPLDQTSQQCTNIHEQYNFMENLGSFGHIWKVKDISSGKIFALKIVKSELVKEKRLLLKEIKILLIMKSIWGFSKIRAYGQDQNFTFFIMDCLGQNLEMIKQSLTIPIVLEFGQQMVDRIEALHQQGIIHRDIKPENFVIGHNDDRKLFLIDFGLSGLYMYQNKHIPFKGEKGMVGTARYASINALKGYEQSRRDDIESLAYLIVYLAQGHLPWMNQVEFDKQTKFQRIYKMKEAATPEMLAFNLPRGVMEFIKYSKNLSFDETPDYQLLKTFLQLPDLIPKQLMINTHVTKNPGAQTDRYLTKQSDAFILDQNTDRPMIEQNINTSRQQLASQISSVSIDSDQMTEKVIINVQNIGKMIKFKKPHSSPKSEDLINTDEQLTSFKQYCFESHLFKLNKFDLH